MFDLTMTSTAARVTFSDGIRVFAPDLLVRLHDMPHYGGIALADDRVHLAAGYFYNFSTRLTQSDVQEILAIPGPVLVPSVRPGGRVILNAPFVRVASHTECVVTLEDPVDECLWARLKSKRAREIRRMARNAKFSFEVIEARELEAKHWNDITRLDALHNERHAAAAPMFCEAVQRIFSCSPLAQAFRWIFRRDASERTVQIGLILLGEEEDTLYYLSQSIDRAALETRQNLYTATFYMLYHWAYEHGFHAVHLGRNGVDEKEKLGANVFIEQHHWLKMR